MCKIWYGVGREKSIMKNFWISISQTIVVIWQRKFMEVHMTFNGNAIIWLDAFKECRVRKTKSGPFIWTVWVLLDSLPLKATCFVFKKEEIGCRSEIVVAGNASERIPELWSHRKSWSFTLFSLWNDSSLDVLYVYIQRLWSCIFVRNVFKFRRDW